ncbi:MAG: VOC family protein [Dehalococcoidia bacterium]|nr:VOC family protein [Dehalococcoidia bacterium]
MTQPAFGRITWVDLTVADAEGIRDFYADVAGWTPAPMPMEGYDDFSMMLPGTEEAVAGVCHARGANAALPPMWLVYITVADLAAASARAVARGATALTELPESLEHGGYQVLRDPAGAAFALFQPAPES